MAEVRLHGPLAVIGHPVSHSLSPAIHNAALRAMGHAPVYTRRDIEPDGLEQGLDDLVQEGFVGLSVTLPHKERILPLLDRTNDLARVIGAVNTVCIDRVGGRIVLTGHNTDVDGFEGPLEPLVPLLHGRPALVFGAGGAARAVVAGLARVLKPETITIATRRPAAAQTLARDLDGCGGERVVPVAWPPPESVVAEHALLVNATPMGMHPDTAGTPVEGGRGLHAAHVVYDLVYRPPTTRLLADASAAGARVIGGLPMLVGQAAEAFRLWTGVPMPLDAVFAQLGHPRS